MADIKVQDLSTHNISGADLFNDSENFMQEVSEDAQNIIGGKEITIMEDPYGCGSWSLCVNKTLDSV